MVTTFELFFWYFARLPSKMNFLQTFISRFSKLDILKMSIFEKLTTTFPRLFKGFCLLTINYYFIIIHKKKTLIMNTFYIIVTLSCPKT